MIKNRQNSKNIKMGKYCPGSRNSLQYSKNYLLGMICVESEGDPTQPNLSGDGGLGLIHMQPLLCNKVWP